MKEIIDRFKAVYSAAGSPGSSNWYYEANYKVQQLADKHDIDFNVCAAVVAALSPRVRWLAPKSGKYPNLNAADTLIKGYRHHKKKSDVFSTVPGYNQNKRKAWKILRQNSPDPLSGPKVTSFYFNIIDPDNADKVTIDSWMYGIAYDLDLTVAKEQYAPKSLKEYDMLRDAVIQAAHDVNVHPVDFQAIVWKHAKASTGYFRTI